MSTTDSTTATARAARVVTVTGDLAPDTLGAVMPHEHLLSDFGDGTEPSGPLTMELLGEVSLGLPNRDNLLLGDEELAVREAFLVQRLRAAGAVILGKTNLSEWANFRSTASSSGWSAVGGQTNNPYVLDRNPCGSSSGSGVAAAASLAAVTVGTETDGSIVCPAGINGVVGIKPTVGLVSRAGVVPISLVQDTAGPLTRNVTDAAAVLSVIQGADPRDPATV
ncbi:amidase family protein, partial [Streptosporangium algeriense]